MGTKEILSLIGGLCLFLYGMKIMGDSLERRAGSGLKNLLSKFTDNQFKGFLTGLGVTAVIQSSSATTVMVVGFVNSGIMTLKQSIGVIIGANVGTTVTAWILSLDGISAVGTITSFLKPSFFTPILALIGTIFIMFSNSNKRKDTGHILLGFATLMFGMDAMSASVKGLAASEGFRNMFVMFENPLLGVLVGAVLTGVIQSSSASVGILQALTVTKGVTYAAAIPIIMGQNIGTCVTALISCFGANKNAKRAALVHLLFNVLGTGVWLTVFWVLSATWSPAILGTNANHIGVAVCHTSFKILCVLLFLPFTSFLEGLSKKIIPDGDGEDEFVTIDDRLLNTPPIAIEHCGNIVNKMAKVSKKALLYSINSLEDYSSEIANKIKKAEKDADNYEDVLGTFLTKLSRYQMSDNDSNSVSKLLKAIGDFERISDHSVNILESAEEIKSKGIEFTTQSKAELDTLCGAVTEIVERATEAFITNNFELACSVEPLEQVIDELKRKLRENHITRLKDGSHTIEVGFVWSDLLTNLERVSDHCSNIAMCVIDEHHHNMNAHEEVRKIRRGNVDFEENYNMYASKYSV